MTSRNRNPHGRGRHANGMIIQYFVRLVYHLDLFLCISVGKEYIYLGNDIQVNGVGIGIPYGFAGFVPRKTSLSFIR